MDSILHWPESKSALLYSAVRAHCLLTRRMCLDCSADIWVTVLTEFSGLRHTCGSCSWDKCNVKRRFSSHRAPCFHSVGRLYTVLDLGMGNKNSHPGWHLGGSGTGHPHKKKNRSSDICVIDFLLLICMSHQ